jgi:hypothetical protein
MSHGIPRSTEGNVVDSDFGEALTMPAFPRVVLPAFLLEDDDFLTAAVADDFAVTFAPLSEGTPVFTVLPSLPSRTSLNSILPPASPTSDGILYVRPASTRNCLPPVLMIA